ncbi:hypothetical protein GTW51_10860 [Aurantimonas aggregata]|uniref:Uncharacterized protein n=1 Tax=Aurantimonas aggregata TaxID=2047720 RepID=A0A6L9MHM8_9HYPH|nr:hypothetical protein [Aurantimonas aggregata]NDV87201.1 hypothetical protein [Aurantimonas aggregata]
MNAKPQIPIDGKHPTDSKELEQDSGKEAREANEAMNKARSDDTAGKDSLIPGLRQSDTGGSAD